MYGLQSLAWTLLDLPGGERSLDILNSDGKSPSQMAFHAGFRKLAQDLENVEVSLFYLNLCVIFWKKTQFDFTI